MPERVLDLCEMVDLDMKGHEVPPSGFSSWERSYPAPKDESKWWSKEKRRMKLEAMADALLRGVEIPPEHLQE